MITLLFMLITALLSIIFGALTSVFSWLTGSLLKVFKLFANVLEKYSGEICLFYMFVALFLIVAGIVKAF